MASKILLTTANNNVFYNVVDKVKTFEQTFRLLHKRFYFSVKFEYDID
jgi:hypothetical protein